MKIKVIETISKEETLTIECHNAQDGHIQKLIEHIQAFEHKLKVQVEDGCRVLSSQCILYGEYVTRTVFLYTKEDVLSTSMTLQQVEQLPGFLRCSKTLVVNIHEITTLKSEINGNIRATLSNDECIMISRHYASILRKALFEGVER